MITYKQFEKFINMIISQQKRDDKMNKNLMEYTQDTNFTGFYRNSFEIFEFIEDIMDDKENGWIQYWMFELENGTKYKKGFVTESKKDIKLKTIKDLYNILTK